MRKKRHESIPINYSKELRTAASAVLFALLLFTFEPAEAFAYDFILPDYIPQMESVRSDKQIMDDLSSLELKSANALLIRLDDDRTLLQRNSEVRTYPASLTKMMTALVVIEQTEDLSEEIILEERIFERLRSANASMAGFRPGVKITIRDLLYGIMLPSGAEASLGLAEHIAGSESAFVELMNQKAVILGMNSTNFMNTTGLHHPEHYSTAEDMAVLLQYALKNRDFARIFTEEEYLAAEDPDGGSGHKLYSTLFMKLKSFKRNSLNGEILGGKTGYTGEAGLCLASYARISGQKYILITMGAPGNLYTEQLSVTDALAIYSRIR